MIREMQKGLPHKGAAVPLGFPAVMLHRIFFFAFIVFFVKSRMITVEARTPRRPGVRFPCGEKGWSLCLGFFWLP